MTGVEVAVVALVGWLWRRARHAGEGVTAQLDEVTDLGVAKVFALVKAKLGDDPALIRLETEAVSSLDGPEVSDRTRRRVVDALAEAAEQDTEFAELLQALMDAMPQVSQVQINAPRDHATVNAPMRGNVTIYQHGVPGSTG